jgi:hypothetical protein
VPSAVSQYLSRHAEPEARLEELVEGRHDAVLVVPAHREGPSFIDGYQAAVDGAPGRVLLILVVNEHDEAAPADAEASIDSFEAIAARLRGASRRGGAVFGLAGGADVLLVDRVLPGRRVPRRRAVGLARKVGLDIALSLHASGRGPRVAHTTDADANLGADYFHVPVETGVSGYVHPFTHVDSGDAAVDRATQLHELFLRYWVAGLGHAGSPYAFHTVGSALAVDLPHYAGVRGVPRRAAGEDFYLLTKLAKLAPVRRLRTAEIRLRSRRSSRTPFGTGHAVERLTRRDQALPDPRCFDVLRDVLSSLSDLALHGDAARYEREVSRVRGAAAVGLVGPEPMSVVVRICREAVDAGDRSSRLNVWFDAFRTMKLLREQRSLTPDLPWRDAVGRAPFAPRVSGDVGEIVRAFGRAEHHLPELRGPTGGAKGR